MSSDRFVPVATPMAGLVVYQLKVLGDHRGSLTRLFCPDELAETPFAQHIAQINLTRTARAGTVRGLHYQHPPKTEDKFLTCLRGEIVDFVVDLRAGSETFLQVHTERLSADNARALLIPKGFAHGFQSLKDDCELLYLHSARFAPDAEDGIDIGDPALGITLPHPITDRSARDSGFAPLPCDFNGLTL